MTSIFHEEALDLTRGLELKRYKIASRTLIDNPQLVKDILDLNKQTFNSASDKGEIKKFNIDNYNFIIEDISKSSMTRGFNITNTENHCKESMDTKTTEIVLEGDRKNKKIYT